MNIKYIEKLIKLLDNSSVEEIEIKSFGKYIRVSKKPSGSIVNSSAVKESLSSIPVETESKEIKKEYSGIKKEEKDKKGLVAVKAPLVGTFYKAPAPDAPPYVEKGDHVKKGDVLCIIEAMKIMNEIESEVEGTVVEILVKNEEPVQFGQELFLIKTD